MDHVQQRVVGGMFGLADLHELQPATPPPFLHPRDILTHSARSGLRLLLTELQPERIWLPSFLCPAILTETAGLAKHSFYEPGLDLRGADRKWIRKVQEGDFVLLIDYFGFRPDPELLAELGNREAILLEDACQALLTESVGQGTDYVLYSPRKFLGVPDGGILSRRGGTVVPRAKLIPAPDVWWLTAYTAGLQRRVFDQAGGSRKWFELFQQSEAELPGGNFSMSKLTHRLLQYAFNYTEIATQRRANYRFLLERLAEFAIFPELPEGVVPLGFPIRLRNRDEVRERLFAIDVFPPIHWSVHNLVPGKFIDSCRLAGEIMTLPCDQRYEGRSLSRMADLVRREGGRCSAI